MRVKIAEEELTKQIGIITIMVIMFVLFAKVKMFGVIQINLQECTKRSKK